MAPMSMTDKHVKFDDTECTTDSDTPSKAPLVPEDRTGRHVRFNPSIDVREVRHWRDLPKEESEATWYTPIEFEDIKRSLVMTIRLMIAKKPLDQDHCTRGLEFRTPAGAKLRKKNKLKALTAVWNEQVAQWKEDRSDEEAISFVYQQEVHECRIIARRLALQDQKEVQHYLGETELDESVSDFSVVSLGESDNHAIEEPLRSAVVPTAA